MKFDVHTGEAVAGGEDALAPPKYWDDVKDPTVAQYFHITSKTHADEYERVLGAFMLTLDPSAFTIHSVHRVQNLSLWKTYAAKRAATCSREDDPEKARRRFPCRNPTEIQYIYIYIIYAIDVTARLPRR